MNQPSPDTAAVQQEEIIIRPERPGDATGLAVAHIAAWRAGHGHILSHDDLGEPDVEGWVARRQQRLTEMRDPRTMVAEADGTVIGHITWNRPQAPDGTVGQIWSCYVHPAWWGTGIADRLMAVALAVLPDREVHVWVLEANQRARRFYERHGFRLDAPRVLFQPSTATPGYPELRYILNR